MAHGEGDLSQRMNLNRSDELGELSDAIDEMLSHQSRMIGSIQQITMRGDS